jgi:ectoine hydroxylase-related dioxygenase (phytanoyl-CoA dioxygenase family)
MSRDHAGELRERGYTVIERTHSPEDVAAFRAALEALYREQGAPVPYAAKSWRATPEIELSPTGFTVFKLLALLPELAPRLLAADVVETVRRLLGRDMHLELTGAALSDALRPFFGWHSHIGGIDVEDYRARSIWPRFTEPERVIAVLYLDDIDAEGGELLVMPRAISDPTEAPHDTLLEDWPGQATVHFPAGSTLIFEQCTWHAARSKVGPGLRMFVGCYFTSAKAPPTENVDDSLPNFKGGGALLESVLPR